MIKHINSKEHYRRVIHCVQQLMLGHRCFTWIIVDLIHTCCVVFYLYCIYILLYIVFCVWYCATDSLSPFLWSILHDLWLCGVVYDPLQNRYVVIYMHYNTLLRVTFDALFNGGKGTVWLCGNIPQKWCHFQ